MDAVARLVVITHHTIAHNMETPSLHSTEGINAFLEDRAFRSRTVLIFGTITDASAAEAARRLVALSADSAEPIDVLVSSPGGHLESGNAIHDVIRFIDAPVNMIGTGWVGSAATQLYIAVPIERRFSLPNTRYLIHQPSGGFGGSGSDIEIQMREIIKAKEHIAHMIAHATGKAIEIVRADIERDYWMDAEEAIQYGLVSKIIERRAQLRG
jgi:ATP-dependent Clp protease, protease subunit